METRKCDFILKIKIKNSHTYLHAINMYKYFHLRSFKTNEDVRTRTNFLFAATIFFGSANHAGNTQRFCSREIYLFFFSLSVSWSQKTGSWLLLCSSSNLESGSLMLFAGRNYFGIFLLSGLSWISSSREANSWRCAC